MIVHVSASFREIDDNIPFLRQIVTAIHKNGDTIARDWVELVANKVNTDRLHKEDWQRVAVESMQALERSDVAIIEATGYGFWEGYVTSRMLEAGKPVLLLARLMVDEWMVSGLTDPLLLLKQYETLEELSGYIKEFLSDVEAKITTAKINYQMSPDATQYFSSLGADTDEAKSKLLNQIVRSARAMNFKGKSR